MNLTISTDDGDCEKSKLLGLRNIVTSVMEQLVTVHDEISSLIDSKDIEPEIISHMEALEPSHQVLAKADLKFEKIKQSQIPSSSTSYSSAGVSSNGIPA